MAPTPTHQNPEQAEQSSVREPAHSSARDGVAPSSSAFDVRAYRAGLIFGAITLIAILGVIKDLRALLNPGGRGQLVFGFLGLRFSSVERVWFGYRFTDTAAWYAAIPHVVLYAAGAYGLISRRRWGWALVLVYLLYIPLSEFLLVVFYGFGYLTGQPAFPQRCSGHTSPIMWSTQCL